MIAINVTRSITQSLFEYFSRLALRFAEDDKHEEARDKFDIAARMFGIYAENLSQRMQGRLDLSSKATSHIELAMLSSFYIGLVLGSEGEPLPDVDLLTDLTMDDLEKRLNLNE